MRTYNVNKMKMPILIFIENNQFFVIILITQIKKFK